MNPAEHAARVRLARYQLKGFRARTLPGMPAIDNAGISTKPWGSGGMHGIGVHFGAGPGPSLAATNAWTRATRRRPKRWTPTRNPVVTNPILTQPRIGSAIREPNH